MGGRCASNEVGLDIVLGHSGGATMQMSRPTDSIPVELDQGRVDPIVIDESIIADKDSGWCLPDRVTGKIPRADSKYLKAVVLGGAAYIAKYDAPRRENMDANGTTARDRIGASIAQITP